MSSLRITKEGQTLRLSRRLVQMIESLISIEDQLEALHTGKISFNIKGKKVVLSGCKNFLVSHPGGVVKDGNLTRAPKTP